MTAFFYGLVLSAHRRLAIASIVIVLDADELSVLFQPLDYPAELRFRYVGIEFLHP